MKILKPGKVEQRKFVCQNCGCVFVARKDEVEAWYDEAYLQCPTCGETTWWWTNGEPYEESVQTDIERLKRLMKLWNFWSNGTCGLEQYLIENGVTFREG